jgi:hypothetical protein
MHSLILYTLKQCMKIRSLFKYQFVLFLQIALLAGIAAAKPAVPSNGVYLGGILPTPDSSLSLFNEESGIQHSSFLAFIRFPEAVTESGERSMVTQFMAQAKSVGAIPVITFETFGGLESYTSAQAAEFIDLIDSYQIPVLIRWNHEMNGSWYPWGNKPGLYIQKFREFANLAHTRSTHIGMAWTPNQGWGYPWSDGLFTVLPGSADFNSMDTNDDGFLTTADDPYTPFYPGDEYVDWVGVSFYHWGNDPHRSNQIPSADKFGVSLGVKGSYWNFHKLFSINKGKPMMIAETSALFLEGNTAQGNASDFDIKAGWLDQVYNTTDASQARLNVDMPGVKAIYWFNVRKFETEVNTYADWRITSKPEILQKYRSKVMDNSYFLKSNAIYNALSFQKVPSTVKSSSQYELQLKYRAVKTVDIVVDFLRQNTSTPWSWHGGTRVTVPQGEGTLPLTIATQAGLELGDNYIWNAMIIPSGGSWTDATNKIESRVTVVPDTVAPDSISFTSVPSAVKNIGVFDVAIKYLVDPTVFRNKKIAVNILNPNNGWSWHGGGFSVLPGPNDTVQVPVIMDQPTQPGNGYIIDAFITDINGDWRNSTANIRKQIEILGPNSGRIEESVSFAFGSPFEYTIGTSTSINLRYEADGNRYLRVNLLDPSKNWEWIAGNETRVSAGSGGAALRIYIPTWLTSRSNLVLHAFLSEQQGDWRNATANHRFGPVSLLSLPGISSRFGAIADTSYTSTFANVLPIEESKLVSDTKKTKRQKRRKRGNKRNVKKKI